MKILTTAAPLNRTAEELAADYKMYRGHCKPLSEREIEKDPTLRLVRGYYHCPAWGAQQHWWCEKPDGTIVDPSVRQFPTAGMGAHYVEFNGIVACEECGKEVHEDDATVDGHHVFCSSECYGHCVGML